MGQNVGLAICRNHERLISVIIVNVRVCVCVCAHPLIADLLDAAFCDGEDSYFCDMEFGHLGYT